MHPRISKRMPCSVAVGDKRHTGLVLNVSQGGLFVQTHAASPAGEAVDLSISPPEGGEIPLLARVVWKRVVPQQLRTSAQGGLGVRIERADERYFHRLADWMRIEMDEPGSSGSPATARLVSPGEPADFVVRVLAQGTRRSKTLAVVASAREEAERAALEAAGTGWRVIEVKPLSVD